MGFKRILIDTNICVDVALVRQPYVSNALHLINLAQTGKVDAYVAAHTFDTIYYIIRKKYSIQQRYTLLEEFRSVYKVAPVTEKIIDKALKLKWPDFEDAIHYQTALATRCDAIITRNQVDYQNISIPVLSPAQLLANF